MECLEECDEYGWYWCHRRESVRCGKVLGIGEGHLQSPAMPNYIPDLLEMQREPQKDFKKACDPAMLDF